MGLSLCLIPYCSAIIICKRKLHISYVNDSVLHMLVLMERMSQVTHFHSNYFVLRIEWNITLWKYNIMNIPFNSLTFCIVLGNVKIQIISLSIVKKINALIFHQTRPWKIAFNVFLGIQTWHCYSRSGHESESFFL